MNMIHYILDVCSGCGGLSFGFKDDGNIIIAIDTWLLALKSWKENNIGHPINCDLLHLPFRIDKLKELIDYLIGSPPCQDFSKGNKLRKFDPRLVKTFMNLKNLLDPKYWIMEEVPDVIKLKIIPEKYIHFFLASDFNLPHRRKRLIAGFYPKPRKNKYRGKKFVRSPIAKKRGIYHGKKDRIKVLKQYNDLFPGIEIKSLRDITPKIYKKIMGFPDNYIILGNKGEKETQIGNSVCPPISKAIYQAIKEGKKVIIKKNLKDFI